MPRKSLKKQPKKKNPMQMIFTRFMLVVAVFVFWIGAIGVRLVHLQINQHEWLSEQAQEQRRDIKKSKLLRGTIYDRSERALAMSIKAKSLYADPAEIEDVERTARKVGEILKIKPSQLVKDLREAKEAKKRFVWLARKLDESTAEKLNAALEDKDLKKSDLPRFAGLHWKDEQKRSYPYKSLAAHIVGFSNSDDIGQAGIELSQEDLLHGAVIKQWQDRDRLGRVYEEQEVEREPPRDVVLTISNSIQYKTEEALAKGVKTANAKSGMAVVLNPKTGEILAMANYPSFDPNRFNEAEPETLTNKAIQNFYSPGSVFKLVTYGSALDQNLIAPSEMIDCSRGSIDVAGHVFRDSHTINTVSYSKALAHSSNVAAIRTGLRVGKLNFYDYARKFGFGEPTGVELPAETRGLLRPTEKWNGDSLASMSIGYEIGVSALQMATAYATIANNGVRIQPHIVKEIRQADGKVVSTTAPTATPVVSDVTARNLRRMLQEVVLDGTGKRAKLNGYTSAGKTGTAWKYNAKLKKVDSGKYISSFMGFAPADDPTIVIAVVIDEPKSGGRDGGQVAAPIFREIAEQVLPELNVAPDGSIRQDSPTVEDIPEAVEDVGLQNELNQPDEDSSKEKEPSKPARSREKVINKPRNREKT